MTYASLFWRQLWALFVKNYIVFWKNRWKNVFRCFLMPVLWGSFIWASVSTSNVPNNFGIGSPVPIASLASKVDGSLALVWADGTGGNTFPTADQIMAQVTSGFSPKQLNAVRKVGSPSDIPFACQESLNDVSECYAAVAFNALPNSTNDSSALNYTIRADSSLYFVDVVAHKSDYEERVLPLQWAIDSAIIELRTGTQTPTPLEWPFTQETNKEQSIRTRLDFIKAIRNYFVIALFLNFVGISYHLAGLYAGERANLLTSHLQAMGLLDSARICSWHLSFSLLYLPGWIVTAVIWHFGIFTATNLGIMLLVHVLLGLSLSSYSLFLTAPFGKAPQLAAINSTFCAMLFAVLALFAKHVSNTTAFIYTVVFPPGFYIFAIRSIAGFELHRTSTSIHKGDPDHGLTLLPLMVAAVINIFLWPFLALLFERFLYDTSEPHGHMNSRLRFWRRSISESGDNFSRVPPNGTAISVRNLNKTYKSPWWHRKKSEIVAISDLTFSIPKFGIFVLLGSNGSGKSTALSIIGNLLSRTSGSIIFEGGARGPPRGTIGIVPQKNVHFPGLTCYQNMKVWSAVKRASGSPNEDIVQVLKDCDLENKIHEDAGTLSGGQKRKLQLAIGLVGGSELLLVDECTSGVDPLSRRALWRTLTSVRTERTVVLTTHFLDEADLLADQIAILASPGKLVAEGSPVSMKSSLGQGYSLQVSYHHKTPVEPSRRLLSRIHTISPSARIMSSSATGASFKLGSSDPVAVERILALVDAEMLPLGIASYDVRASSLEDIFLSLMKQHEKTNSPILGSGSDEKERGELGDISRKLVLTNGRPQSPLRQALTIFHKRAIVARRSWLTPLVAIVLAIVGSCVPSIFIKGHDKETCAPQFANPTALDSLYFPSSPLQGAINATQGNQILTTPPNIMSTIGQSASMLATLNVADNATFVSDIKQNFLNLSVGGISINANSGEALFAWEATPPGLTGPIMLNLASNILFNRALNATGRSSSLISANYQSFPSISSTSFVALEWVIIFGVAMAAFPAFFALYVANERRTSVKAMQMSNGLNNPVGLWLGHLLFDTVSTIIIATVITIVLAASGKGVHGLGFLWVIIVLYGIAATLCAYVVSLFLSPLAAFATVAAYQIVTYSCYILCDLLILTFAKPSKANHILSIANYAFLPIAPVNSVVRAALLSVNLFSLICDGSNPVTIKSMGTLGRFSGPIVYLIGFSVIFFVILIWHDSGSPFSRQTGRSRKRRRDSDSAHYEEDVIAETKSVAQTNDPLRILNVTKNFKKGGVNAVDNVSFGVQHDSVLALLGPNGAGKTTTFNIIRGDVVPTRGDVLIQGTSVITSPRAARLSLGVCPQFTAIDSHLTVREHLMIYGRLKGLNSGVELSENVEVLLNATALSQYADRLASKLSGGNQRKLSLAIALLGNPSVLLIDEFSTGVDAKMKRDMWGTLRTVASGKAVVITTHSMEEASALANKVGIIASKMLAVGSMESLAARYPIYEVHFSCRTRQDITRAQQLMARIPGARMADDVATRFEVPVDSERTLADLFRILNVKGDFSEYTVERVSLESIFLKVIKANNIAEEDKPSRNRRRRRWFCCWCC
ncbi:P-loop containing nucleoside triphosphate hydrolase protein [Rickenella mellea]|uniref:P-loop containing nucleoside triphosphate hydrolase protein n=1 Tax=Rickenella mellea TaxID=50990 RepID=A0A4Y7QH02_9AGAM|nr:P-loop containing nucleoside triphosphate hydrolase protein [Rickenella mellea]